MSPIRQAPLSVITHQMLLLFIYITSIVLPRWKHPLFIRQPCGIRKICSATSAWAPRGRGCVRYVVVTAGDGGEAAGSAVSRPTDQADRCLFLPGPTVYFHEGINVYSDMPLVLFQMSHWGMCGGYMWEQSVPVRRGARRERVLNLCVHTHTHTRMIMSAFVSCWTEDLVS